MYTLHNDLKKILWCSPSFMIQNFEKKTLH
jgi:hypothetical protein